MSWTDIEPIVKIAPRATASISAPKSGAPRVMLALSETLMKELGQPSAANVQAGTGENAGKVRLAFGGGGKFALTEFEKGGARIVFPIGAGMPAAKRKKEACTIEAREKTGGGVLIVALPIEAWERQVAPPARIGAGVDKRPAPATVTSSKRLDAVAYLTSKGVKISRRDGGFMLNGTKISAMGALSEVNRFRRNSELEPLGLGDIE